jgi:hypothetical protein
MNFEFVVVCDSVTAVEVAVEGLLRWLGLEKKEKVC